ncbi:MAG: hypothetical protein JST80_09490 [Bdellovibrionales bacterium]|nr:hypothetical protein [Bdellovibrionales bacterium]
MKHLLAAAVFTAFAFSACTKKEPETITTPTPIVNETLLTAGKVLEKVESVDTPYKIYQFLSADPKNICISPLSLEQAFGMAYLGAGGRTKEQIEKLFGFKNDEIRSLKNEDLGGNVEFLWGNSIWSKPGKTLSPSYLENVKSKLDTYHANSIDPKKINAWVEKTTKGKIKEIIHELSLETNTVLVNAFYINAPWEQPFKKEELLFGPFQSNPSMSSQVTYLSRIDSMKYYEDKNSIWVEIPYKGRMTMLMALPKKKFDLRTLEDSLSAKYVQTVLDGLRYEKVDLKFPKFKIESSLSFKKVLADMGYADLFKVGDWSRLTLLPDVKITEVLQATSLNVDEHGTEGAAATAIEMRLGSASQLQKPKRFYANEPFLFMLRHANGHLYFIGRVYDPKI